MYFTEERIGRILQEIEKNIYSHTLSIEHFRIKKGEDKNGGRVDIDTGNWSDYTLGDKWNGYMEHCWFRTEVIIPDELENHDVTLEVTTGRESYWDSINPQMMVYVDGKLIHALDINHRFIDVVQNAKAGEKHLVAIYAYSGRANEEEPPIDLKVKMHRVNRNVQSLYYNMHVPHEAAKLYDANDKNKVEILNHLNHAINLLDLRHPLSEAFFKSVETANDYMEKEFYQKCCKDTDFTINVIGHSHLDVAWGWTVKETREKAVRTFANMLNLMNKYEEYTFIASQPVLYKFVKEDYPEIYEQVKKRIKEGRWEPEGAMWLEADCNLSSGESLVRQILYGKRFFKEEFGVESKVLWLPDVFGYSAAMPQILKKSNVDYFMTTKIGWNEYNKMPVQSFMWEGIDGSNVLTHLVSGYGNAVLAREYKDSYEQYLQKDIHNESLFAYGFSDGGGGATPEMVENQRRYEKGIPGLAKAKHGKVLAFFERLEEDILNDPKMPKWVGELYLEYHRGTYTSMARNKRKNRYSELLYQDTELFMIMADQLCKTDIYAQNKERLKDNWELILLNQFHDILPGSSIKEVYQDSDIDYDHVKKTGKQLLEQSLDAICHEISLNDDSIIVFNQSTRDRSDIVAAEGIFDGEISLKDGSEHLIETQKSDQGLLFYADTIPAKGYKSFKYEKMTGQQKQQKNTAEYISENEIKTDFYHIKMNDKGELSSIYDRINERELLQPGKTGNQLQAFEDIPLQFASWDINLFYQEKMWTVDDLKDITVVENGPVRASVRIEKKFCNSTIIQHIRVYKHLERIDFDTYVDWQERQVLLKAAFPVDIHANTATYEIQYGNIERPTHQNTSWDKAKFEVCAQRWADLSEGGYGVSLLNNCKYGHDIVGGNMRLTLIKSSGGWPYPDADNETHHFTYSLYPHTGNWKCAKTADMAYQLNSPMYARICGPNQGKMDSSYSLLSCKNDNVMIETVKQSEDGQDIIVRVYEYKNIRTNTKIMCNIKGSDIVECNLLEEETGKENLHFNGTALEFVLKPYEIKTFKIIR